MKTFLFGLLMVAGSFAHADKIQVSCKDSVRVCSGSVCDWKQAGSEKFYDVTMKVGPLGEKVGVWLGQFERTVNGRHKQLISVSQVRGSSPIWNHYIDSTIDVDGIKISTKGEIIVSTQYENSKTLEDFLTECSLGVARGIAGIDAVM